MGERLPDPNAAVRNGNLMCDVFATFVPCTRGATPCFATEDDYDATDAFSADRLLDSFAMQLVLRTDIAAPLTPVDPWKASGALTASGGALTAANETAVQTMLLNATAGPAAPAVEYPPGFDSSSVFLARILIAATKGAAAGQPPAWNLAQITIDNHSRLFVYSAGLLARLNGLGAGNGDLAMPNYTAGSTRISLLQPDLAAGQANGTVVLDSRRTRPLWFDGRFLKASDLEREQNYFLTREADLAQASGFEGIHGLMVERVGRREPIGRFESIVIRAGYGVTPANELVTVSSDLVVPVSELPVESDTSPQPGPANRTQSTQTRTGLFVIALQPVEFDADPVTAYPTTVQGLRA